MAEKPQKNSGDQRAKTVGTVWGAAIAMMALCIPLCAVLKSAMLPIVVVVGTAAVTFYIWNSGEKIDVPKQSENEALKAKIRELEERLANVEVINRFEDRLAEKQLRQAQKTRAVSPEAPRSHAREQA